MSFNSEAVLFRKYLEMLKLLHIYLNHFPNHEKFGLAQSIRKYSMHKFRKAAKRGDILAMISLFAHAAKTASLKYLAKVTKEVYRGKYVS